MTAATIARQAEKLARKDAAAGKRRSAAGILWTLERRLRRGLAYTDENLALRAYALTFDQEA